MGLWCEGGLLEQQRGEAMSQESEILHALKYGRKLTPLAALRLFGCLRLAARVYDLRRSGHTIHSGKQEVNGKRFSVYWM